MLSLKTSRVEALAEISDFVAGLVQRVPKKMNKVKSDLQNSTASHGDDHLPTFYKKLNEDRHPERGNLFPSRMGIDLVWSSIDDC